MVWLFVRVSGYWMKVLQLKAYCGVIAEVCQQALCSGRADTSLLKYTGIQQKSKVFGWGTLIELLEFQKQ